MQKFLLWNSNFLFETYINVEKEDVQDLFNKIEYKILNKNLTLVNAYIFTSYDLDIVDKFVYDYNINLIFSREDNKFNIQIIYLENDNESSISLIKESWKIHWINIKNELVNTLYVNNFYIKIGSFEEQTSYIYNNLFNLYKELWYTNNDFIKAWNFIPEILENYDDFNIERNKQFKKEWIISNYPAWTWIDCILKQNIKHLANFLFIKTLTNDIVIENISSKLQCDAECYWPKFSRAKLIKSKLDKNDILFISWTAAVDESGNSIFTENIEENIKYTFKSIENLLSQAQMNFDNIVSSFVYIKNKKYYDIFLEIYRENNCKFPYIYNFCDICRDDFLFEIECIAVKSY